MTATVIATVIVAAAAAAAVSSSAAARLATARAQLNTHALTKNVAAIQVTNGVLLQKGKQNE
jgi:hypothetical protein